MATSSSTDGGDTEGVDDTADGGVGEGGGEGGGVPCGYADMLGDFELVNVPPRNLDGTHHRDFIPAEDGDCDFTGILFDPPPDEDPDDWAFVPAQSPVFEVFVYHPQDASGAWPEGLEERPVVFFAPGNGFALVTNGEDGTLPIHHLYLTTIEALVEDGFVVFAIDPTSEGNVMTTRIRRAALACTMLWARDQWQPDAGLNTPPTEPLSPYMVLMGHSRGGGGAYLLTSDLLTGDHLPAATSLDDWNHCATATFAQSYGVGGSVDYVEPMPYVNAPPFLTMQGTIDEDEGPESIQAYDNRASEVEESASGLASWDEVAVVAHGQIHSSWGGFGQSNELGPYYATEFLRWQMMGEDASRRRFMDLMDVGVDPCAFDDLSFADASNWDGPLQLYYSGCGGAPAPVECVADPLLDLEGLGRPLIYANFTQGQNWVDADRFVIDTLERVDGPCALFGAAEQDGDRYTVPLGESTSGGQVRVMTTAVAPPGSEGGPCVCIGPPDLLNGIDVGPLPDVPDACDAPGAFVGSPDYNAHEGDTMLVRFGGEFGSASIRWSLVPSAQEGDVLDISSYTHLSVRIANLVTDDGSCDEIPDEFTVAAALEDADGDPEPSVVSLGTLVESDTQAGGVGAVCRSAQFMRTFRVPLASVCAEGRFAITQATAVTLSFDDPEQSHFALLDSIELVRDPAGAAQWPAGAAASCAGLPPPPEPCPDTPPAGFDCVASPTLAATETSCLGEPVGGECVAVDTVRTEVALPLVDAGTPGEYSGWVVNVPTGWVRDLHDPTPAQIDDIRARCAAACALEFSDQPFIDANCEPSQFLEPTLRTENDRPARAAILDHAADGSGSFPNQSLTCDLRTDCCEAFDEDLCAARPHRPTSASEPLTRGEEYYLDVSGTIEADSTFALTSVQADIEGTVGYSECTAGNDDGPCPFYLGSLDLELVAPLSLGLDCDGSTTVHVLDALEIHLVQPAFGIAEKASGWVQFPEGALVLQADGVVNGVPFHAIGPAMRAIKILAESGSFSLQGTDGARVDLLAPCGAATAAVTAWLGLEVLDWPGEPPSVSIDVPAAVPCPSGVSLAATTSDPEQDVDRLRWLVDGVLLDEAMTAVDFTTGHRLTAIVRDERGATRTVSKTVACQ